MARTRFVERMLRVTAAQGSPVIPEEVAELADQTLRPGPPLATPVALPAFSPESVARGREMYVKGCAACHGDRSKGDGPQDQRNDDGTPPRPRDLTRGIFKGGRDPAHLYAHIMLGLTGSPVPSSADAYKPREAGDLINYILSLSDPATQEKVAHKRRQIVAKRTGQTLIGEIGEAALARREEPTPSSPQWFRHLDP